MYAISSTSEKGILVPKENFTGTVWVNLNVDKNDAYNIVIGTVTFEPKARTNWHSHTSGQLLFVIEGIGYYQEIGKPIQLIRKGDVVKIPKNVKHWHRAAHNNLMRHVAMIPDSDKYKTEWFEAVSDVDYNSFKIPAYEVENNVSAKSIMNHEQLWPDYVSKTKITDPDLIEIFDNFAFDEVISHDTMDVKLRVLLIMASTIGSQALTEYKMFVNAGLNVGITPVAIKEVLYQSVPYVGISKVIDFIHATNEIFTEKKHCVAFRKSGYNNACNPYRKRTGYSGTYFRRSYQSNV